MTYKEYLEEALTHIDQSIEQLRNAKSKWRKSIDVWDCDIQISRLQKTRKQITKMIDEV